MTTWPEHITGSRATSGGRQRDNATCTWNGRDFHVLAATTTLARELVAAGCPDQPWESYTPKGTRSLYGRSLHAWAGRIITEDNQGFHNQSFAEYTRKAEAARSRFKRAITVDD